MAPGNFVIAVHGGAGTVSRHLADVGPYHQGLADALREGHALLAAGGRALDAVQAAVMVLEDNPLFNAGKGSVYTAAGSHEMDAALMDGGTLAAGAVAGVGNLRNPVALARAVMDSGGPVLLAGAGAEAFAREQGFAVMPADYFHTRHRLAQLERAQQQDLEAMVLDHSGAAALADGAPLDEGRKFGTVGSVALDASGNLAAAVSTGGMTNKRPGRLGDSPLVGAGLYANNESCAVSATGSGEHFIRAVVAHDVHARMRYLNERLEDAAAQVIQGRLSVLGGEGGLVAVDRAGNVAMPFNSRGMYRGFMRQGELPRTFIYA